MKDYTITFSDGKTYVTHNASNIVEALVRLIDVLYPNYKFADIIKIEENYT